MLSDRGLEPAIESLAARTVVPVTYRHRARLPAARAGRGGGLLRRRRGADQRRQVRATPPRCPCGRARQRLRRIEVADDGVGGAAARRRLGPARARATASRRSAGGSSSPARSARAPPCAPRSRRAEFRRYGGGCVVSFSFSRRPRWPSRPRPRPRRAPARRSRCRIRSSPSSARPRWSSCWDGGGGLPYLGATAPYNAGDWENALRQVSRRRRLRPADRQGRRGRRAVAPPRPAASRSSDFKKQVPPPQRPPRAARHGPWPPQGRPPQEEARDRLRHRRDHAVELHGDREGQLHLRDQLAERGASTRSARRSSRRAICSTSPRRRASRSS